MNELKAENSSKDRQIDINFFRSLQNIFLATFQLFALFSSDVSISISIFSHQILTQKIMDFDNIEAKITTFSGTLTNPLIRQKFS